jgi:hypothetical protein
MHNLDIPSWRSNRKHDAIVLPLDEDEIREAEAEVRPFNTQYSEMLNSYGCIAIIDLAYRESRKAQHLFTNPDKQKNIGSLRSWRQFGAPLLCSSENDILTCLHNEGIAPSVATRKSLRDLFSTDGDHVGDKSEWMQRCSQAFTPCIYIRELVDSDGKSPTPIEAERAIELLRQYVSGDDEFAIQNTEIDNLSRGVDNTVDDIKQGFHYFLDGLRQRAASVLTFCAALEKLLSKFDESSRSMPLPWTLKYIGYVETASVPFPSYSADSNQSWFSELLRNVFRYLDSERGFQLDTHVIFFCVCREECKIGEVLLSRSAQAYIETGTGMGVAPAGLSISFSKINEMKHGDAIRLWKLTMKFRYRGPFVRDLTEHESLLPEYNKYVESVRATMKKREKKTEKKPEAKRKKKPKRDPEERARLLQQAKDTIAALKAEIEEIKARTVPMAELEEDYQKLLDKHAEFRNSSYFDDEPESRAKILELMDQDAAAAAAMIKALKRDRPRRARSQEI